MSEILFLLEESPKGETHTKENASNILDMTHPNSKCVSHSATNPSSLNPPSRLLFPCPTDHHVPNALGPAAGCFAAASSQIQKLARPDVVVLVLCRTSALRPNAEPLHFGSAEPLHFEQMQNLCTSSKCRTSALWICRTSALWTHRQWSQSAEPLISSQPISAPRSRERTSAQQASSPSPSASRPVELVQALCAKAMIEFFSCLFLS